MSKNNISLFFLYGFAGYACVSLDSSFTRLLCSEFFPSSLFSEFGCIFQRLSDDVFLSYEAQTLLG